MTPLPISEQIAANVVATLQNINGSGSYYTTLSSVIRANSSLEDVTVENLQTIVWDWSVKFDKKGKPPWGQVEWTHLFEIRTYIRQSINDPDPIGKAINLARADIERALMADPRRGGLCCVDNEIADIDPMKDSTSGVYAFSVLLQCEYRTLRGQPNVLAPAGTNEQYFQGGAIVLLAPYTSPRTFGPWRMFQDLRVMPALDPDTESIESDRNDGLSRKTDILFSGHKLKFTVESDFQNQDLLKWRMGGNYPVLQNQSSQSITVSHLVAPDSVVPLHDASGNPIFPVTAVSIGAYVQGTDYTVLLNDGLVLIPPNSTIPAGSVAIAFTSAAYTSKPAFTTAAAPDSRYRCRIIWNSSDGQQLVYGDFDASVVAIQTTSEPAAMNTTTLSIAVLDDASGKVPCGKFIQVAGPLPNTGF